MREKVKEKKKLAKKQKGKRAKARPPFLCPIPVSRFNSRHYFVKHKLDLEGERESERMCAVSYVWLCRYCLALCVLIDAFNSIKLLPNVKGRIIPTEHLSNIKVANSLPTHRTRIRVSVLFYFFFFCLDAS